MLNFIDLHAKIRPDAPAVHFGKGVITYSKLASVVASVSQRLLDNQINENCKVGIEAHTEILEELILALSLSAIGAQWIGKSVLANGQVTPDKVITNLAEAAADKLLIIDDWYDSEPMPLPSNHSKKTWFVTSTSGATGLPKLINLSNEVVTQRISCHPVAYGNDVCSRNAGTLFPLGFSFGMMSSLSPLLRGGTLVLNSGSLEDSESNLCNIEHLTISPQILALFLEDKDRFSTQFRSLKSIMLSGSKVPNALINNFREFDSIELFSSYGASEVGPVANMRLMYTDPQEDAAGYVYPWVDVESVDDNHDPLPIGQEGTLRIKTPYMIHEYANDLSSTQKSFIDGWFYPGDIGFVTEDRLLCITGRIDEIINIGGRKLAPDRIESLMCEYPGVRDAAVFSVAGKSGIEDIWAAVATIGGPINFGELHQKCVEQFGKVAAPKKIIHVASIPRTETGKIQRDLLKKQLTRSE